MVLPNLHKVTADIINFFVDHDFVYAIQNKKKEQKVKRLVNFFCTIRRKFFWFTLALDFVAQQSILNLLDGSIPAN
jgi:hypothetical protein